MILKKVISTKIGFRSEHVDNGDGTYHVKAIPFPRIPQREIDMHPLEEAETLARWSHNDIIAAAPKAPSKDQEMEWLIEHGGDFVKQKRIEMQQLIDAAQPAIVEAEVKWRAAEKAWNEHCEWCVANEKDYDTYIKS